jgi:hypothetical protein
MKPIVDCVDNGIFVSYKKTDDKYYLEFFELCKGGLRFKCEIEDKLKDKL